MDSEKGAGGSPADDRYAVAVGLGPGDPGASSSGGRVVSGEALERCHGIGTLDHRLHQALVVS